MSGRQADSFLKQGSVTPQAWSIFSLSWILAAAYLNDRISVCEYKSRRLLKEQVFHHKTEGCQNCFLPRAAEVHVLVLVTQERHNIAPVFICCQNSFNIFKLLFNNKVSFNHLFHSILWWIIFSIYVYTVCVYVSSHLPHVCLQLDKTILVKCLTQT